jgi:hypothetical protein
VHMSRSQWMMNLVARTGHYIRQGSKFGRCSKKSRCCWCRVCIYFVSNPFICSLAYLVRSSKVYIWGAALQELSCVSVGSADILAECLLDIYWEEIWFRSWYVVRFKISIPLALVHLSILDDLNYKYGKFLNTSKSTFGYTKV